MVATRTTPHPLAINWLGSWGYELLWEEGMGKELSDMTLEELWELFLIFLVEHDDIWHQQYGGGRLIELLFDCLVKRVSYIGSTAENGIWAKNTVDVIVELPSQSDLEKAADKPEYSSFIMMSDEGKCISFNLGRV